MTSRSWVASAVVRLTSSAPCSAEKMKRASLSAGAESTNSPRAAPRLRIFASQVWWVRKKPSTRTRISAGSARISPGKRAAQADAVTGRGKGKIRLDIEIKHRHRARRLIRFDGSERRAEAGDIA